LPFRLGHLLSQGAIAWAEAATAKAMPKSERLLVEADYQHYWSVNQVECAAPDGEGTAEQITQEVAAIDAQLQQLERIVGGI